MAEIACSSLKQSWIDIYVTSSQWESYSSLGWLEPPLLVAVAARLHGINQDRSLVVLPGTLDVKDGFGEGNAVNTVGVI